MDKERLRRKELDRERLKERRVRKRDLVKGWIGRG